MELHGLSQSAAPHNDGEGDNPNLNKKLFFLIGGLVFTKMLVLNFLTPLMIDDFGYATATSVFDVWQRVVYHYLIWEGRFVTQFILRFILMFPKFIFNILNALIYVGLTILIYKFATVQKKHDILLYLFIVFSIWLYTAAYGHVFLYATGSVIYLWGAVIILSFLLPYYLYISDHEVFKHKYIPIAGMFLIGIIAGWCIESMSGGMILIVSLFFVYCLIFKKKIKIWMISGLLGSVIGLLGLVLAPGNFSRIALGEYEVYEWNSFMIFADRASTITNYLYNNFLVLMVILIVLVIINLVLQRDYKRLCISFIFYIASIATAYAMVLSPHIPERTMFGATIFMIIACAHLFAGISFEKESLKIVVLSFICILAFQFTNTFINATIDIAMTKVTHDRKISFIESEIARGNLDIIIPHRLMTNLHASERSPWNPIYSARYITGNPNHWTNVVFAEYFGLHSVKNPD